MADNTPGNASGHLGDGQGNTIKPQFGFGQMMRVELQRRPGVFLRRRFCAASQVEYRQDQNHWRKLKGIVLLPEVIAGMIFKDGTKRAA